MSGDKSKTPEMVAKFYNLVTDFYECVRTRVACCLCRVFFVSCSAVALLYLFLFDPGTDGASVFILQLRVRGKVCCKSVLSLHEIGCLPILLLLLPSLSCPSPSPFPSSSISSSPNLLPASLSPRRDTSADSQLAPYERLATDKYDRSVDSHHKAIDGINIANGLPDMRTVAQVRVVVSHLHVSLLTRDARTGS